MPAEYAGVCLLDAPYSIDREYDYRIPDGMDVGKGNFVSVPFGGGNRRLLGLVCNITSDPTADKSKIKPISAVCSPELFLDGEMLGLIRFMREQTLCTTGDAVHAMIPAAVLAKLTEYYLPNPAAASVRVTELPPAELMILSHIREHGRVSAAAVRSRFGSGAADAVSALEKKRIPLIIRELEPMLASDGQNIKKTEKYCECLLSAEELTALLEKKHPIHKRPASAAQVAVLEELAKAPGGLSEALLRAASGAGAAQLASLEKKGIIRRVLKDEPTASSCGKEKTEIVEPLTERPAIRLNGEQQTAYDTLTSLCSDGQAHGALLYGVTGSGKTAVMLALIDSLLDAGKGVIVLLPEIALTPQSLSIFCGRYGRGVAVIHSGLTSSERSLAWNRIREGEAKLVVGTRSAVFSPIKDLGAIIIDEEQEHTYKSDMSPRYHTRDIARFRSAASGALMLLCSATPSVESFKKACDGKYTMVKLTQRYGGARLPAVKVCDMRREVKGANLSPIGKELSDRLCEVYNRGEQSILFLNRRGYNNFISCASCGEAVSCPRCSVSMTYHTRGKNYEDGELVCHWCGRHMPVPEKCPDCGGNHLMKMGYGTQRVEQELRLLLPGAEIIRMDTDTTSTRESYDRLLGDFRAHRGDVLLGTQMVTKGHDFPDVTLVGVLLADMSLYLDDYRAGERTFAMLTQVIGRAGRASKSGEAIIQTNNPDNEIIKLACAQDYDSFYEREIRLRRALTFPPYCDIVLINVTSEDERASVLAAKELAEKLRILTSGEFSDVPVITFGPFEAPVYRVDGKYRMRLVIKCRLCGRSRALFSRLQSEFVKNSRRGPVLSIDFNPTNL